MGALKTSYDGVTIEDIVITDDGKRLSDFDFPNGVMGDALKSEIAKYMPHGYEKEPDVGDIVVVNGTQSGKTFVNTKGVIACIRQIDDDKYYGVDFGEDASKIFSCLHDLNRKVKTMTGFFVHSSMVSVLNNKMISDGDLIIFEDGTHGLCTNDMVVTDEWKYPHSLINFEYGIPIDVNGMKIKEVYSMSLGNNLFSTATRELKLKDGEWVG